MVIEVTGDVQKQAWASKTMPPVEQVRSLVWSVPITAQDLSVRYTLSYLLLNEAGECIVVDPGLDSDEGWQQLLDGLAVAGTTLDSVAGVVVTHYHPDHLGMVARLVNNISSPWVGMHQKEFELLDRRQNVSGLIPADRNWLEQCGVPDDVIDSVVLTPDTYGMLSNLARPTKLLKHNELLPFDGRRIRVISTPGHTEGHMCLVDEDSGVILTGDHVLPRISPNVGIFEIKSGRNALAEYLQSLTSIAHWDSYEACPAHEYRFRGLESRVRDLLQHHEERTLEIANALLASDLSLWELAKSLSWSRGWASLTKVPLRSALGETVAHVEYLVSTGRVAWLPSEMTGLPHYTISLMSASQ